MGPEQPGRSEHIPFRKSQYWRVACSNLGILGKSLFPILIRGDCGNV